MKVAFVFPPMWTPHSDGSLQIWNQEVTARLSKMFDVLVYCAARWSPPQDGNGGVRYRRCSTIWDERFVKRFALVHDLLRIERPLFSFDCFYAWYARNIASDLRKENCDIVHVYNFPQFASLIKRFNPHTRVVLNMHGEWLTRAKFSNLAAKLSKLDAIVGCSDLISNAIRAKFPEVAGRCRTVPMGVSAVTVCDDPTSIRDHGPEARLLYVGRISPEKGVHVLLDAFDLILREHPRATLTVVGPESVAPREHIVNLSLGRAAANKLRSFYEGSYLAQLKAQLSPEAVARVKFAGPVAYQDVSTYYADADVYINPSFYESFGMSIIEAMAAGVPVVATEVGAVPEIIRDRENGLLVASDCPQAISDAVITLLRNTMLRRSLARAARESVARRFTWPTICSALLQMYEDVVKSGTITSPELLVQSSLPPT